MSTEYTHPETAPPLQDASLSTKNSSSSSPLKIPKNSRLESGLEQVRQIILSSTDGTAPFIQESMAQMLNAGGKMLRPALLLLAGWYGEKNEESLYRLAASVEMLHVATLIHDDILDDAAVRRGRAALHVTAGAKAAVLLGDYLFARCFSLLDSVLERDTGLNAARVIERICDGEIRQNWDRYSLKISMREYLRRICAKTAALISASLTLGAQHGGCSTEEIQRFRRIGYDLGMAFQIIDDLLDFSGDQVKTGKPVARDLSAGIFTAPVIFSLKSSREQELRTLLASPPYSNETLEKVLNIVRHTEGVEKSRDLAKRYTDHAQREIEKLSPGLTRDQLAELAGNLLSRQS